jgi:rod shape determining protein RodA
MFNFRLIKQFDITLFLLACTLCAIGLVNLYSATYNMNLNVFTRQILWVSAGAIMSVVISLIDYRVIERYTPHFYLIILLLLFILLFTGKEISGAKSWFDIGGLASFQPSEFVKLSVILMLARFYHNDYGVPPYGLFDLLKPIAVILIPILLVILQPDLGTAFILALISISILLFAGMKSKHLILSIVAICILCVPLWNYALKDYQKVRIKSFMDPAQDPLGSGYHSTQSKIAIGSGKLTGKGFKQGTQTQLRFLPEQHTDFAFSVIAEEWGFLGSVFTVLLFFTLILWILDTSSRAKDKFSMYACFGIASMFFWHTFINISMVIGIFPVTGLPLLFISYGGSATLTSLISIGIVMSVRMRKHPVSEHNISLNNI